MYIVCNALFTLLGHCGKWENVSFSFSSGGCSWLFALSAALYLKPFTFIYSLCDDKMLVYLTLGLCIPLWLCRNPSNHGCASYFSVMPVFLGAFSVPLLIAYAVKEWEFLLRLLYYFASLLFKLEDFSPRYVLWSPSLPCYFSFGLTQFRSLFLKWWACTVTWT